MMLRGTLLGGFKIEALPAKREDVMLKIPRAIGAL